VAVGLRLVPTGIGEALEQACWLEATAPKLGNVHPAARFVEMDYWDFVRSAEAIGGVADTHRQLGFGELAREMIAARRRQCAANTNLGIVLLCAPVVVAARRVGESVARASFRAALADELAQLLAGHTPEDAAGLFEAISLAGAGGLGEVESCDVHGPPPADVLVAMRLAEQRDRIAWQYTHRFEEVIGLSERLTQLEAAGLGWLEALRRAQLEVLASGLDSLVLRRLGPGVAAWLQGQARRLLELSSSSPGAFETSWRGVDRTLRRSGGRINPGTTADLLAAAALVALLAENWPLR
jgi:triphosphoribosyl-dephospho-CoA synthase